MSRTWAEWPLLPPKDTEKPEVGAGNEPVRADFQITGNPAERVQKVQKLWEERALLYKDLNALPAEDAMSLGQKTTAKRLRLRLATIDVQLKDYFSRYPELVEQVGQE